MTPRTAQYLAAGLAVALIVLVGAVIFTLLRPSQGPSASASPTTVALASPSGSPSLTPFPTFSAGLSPSPLTSPTLVPILTPTPAATPVITPLITPEITPVITPEITPVVTPTVPATATPEPTITAAPTPTSPPATTSPPRELRLSSLGLDARNDFGIERKITFGVDGPSLIRAEISNASADAKICLWKGNQVQARQCDNSISNGALERATFDTGSSNWTLTLISADDNAVVVDLALDFNATSPTADLRDFKFLGTPTPAYNGYTAAVDTLPGGQLKVTGDFDFGEQHMWHVVVQEAGGGGGLDESGGPSNSFSTTPIDVVASNTTYVVAVTNPNTTTEPLPVFLRSMLSWP